MIAPFADELAEVGDGEGGRFEFASPRPMRSGSEKLNLPTAFAASSDEKMMQNLTQTIVDGNLITFLAFTARESIRILERLKICIVVCDDRLSDGRYEDILNATKRFEVRIPVIVVSPTGNWSEYLNAINTGAFDYLADPPLAEVFPGQSAMLWTRNRKRTTRDNNVSQFFERSAP